MIFTGVCEDPPKEDFVVYVCVCVLNLNKEFFPSLAKEDFVCGVKK